MDEHEPEVVAQTTITLPFLDEEVPALCQVEGRPYIPVFAVCHALGIRADIHIRRWRRLLLWVTARKLPFKTEKRGTRLVWCLLSSEVPFLYGLFNCADIDTLLERYAEVLCPRLDSESAAALADLCEDGRALFQEATDHARKMLHEQGELPVVDAVKIDANNQVIDTFSMPLLPLVRREDRERFFEFMNLLTAWRQDITAFEKERGWWPDTRD